LILTSAAEANRSAHYLTGLRKNPHLPLASPQKEGPAAADTSDANRDLRTGAKVAAA
jgi:hypothetical protein